MLINKLDERGWSILNGTFGEKGGWTYIGEVGAPIDYVIANDLAREEIEKITEGIRTESDHAPLEVKVYGLIEMERKEQKKTIEIERSDWTEEGIKSYEKCEG